MWQHLISPCSVTRFNLASMKSFLHISVLCFCISICFAHSTTSALFPNGDAWSRPDSGLQCPFLLHMRCLPDENLNSFGVDFDDAGSKWTKELCEKDSDGDGLTNGEELGDPCCTWTPEKPTPLRMTMISHPGASAMRGAQFAPKCVDGMILPSSLNPMPSIPNVCGEMRKSIAVACVCFSTFRKMIRPPMKGNVLVMCMRRFGGSMKLNMLQSACNGFRESSGRLKRGMILNAVGLLQRCPLRG